jgi:hypothetical protein
MKSTMLTEEGAEEVAIAFDRGDGYAPRQAVDHSEFQWL